MKRPFGTILKYEDMKDVPAADSGESLVEVGTYDPAILAEYEQHDMRPYTGEQIFVRDTLARKLANVNDALMQSGLRLRVVYGYRHPEVQTLYFNRRKDALRKERARLSEDELTALAHNYTAEPSLGGHPMGAAVDLTMAGKDGMPVDMGTAISDFSTEKIVTDAAGLTSEQVRNRRMLHDAMVAEGFAPYYGEWWHFSYGDKEWAAFYGRPSALFARVNFKFP
ncbi:D-alanyl-D-alanine carboxypeptidase family protein [Patescibacteria group bacterium]|nr:D-alanyl-D-alanine carboxypeptidase family protein [Patescibacteria group bacterium]